MSGYRPPAYEIGRDTSVLQSNRLCDKLVQCKPHLPGAVILIHGVNDVGVSYDQAEQGLCAGLGDRLAWGDRFQSGSYRMPVKDDQDKLEDDPDAVFFKRQLREGHHTPVIPFYWGYREESERAMTQAGQNIDRYSNRLDKDLSKGGGPFANATGSLVDMWNRGFSAGPYDIVDRLSADPLRPVLKGPGRLYMILAARRLAALISMVRDYDPDEVVNLVAHSQGCMLSLLAQAFLMQEGLRPADTLVLTHPPYSLVDDVPFTSDVAEMLTGGEDARMQGHYHSIGARQTLHARLETLARIATGVTASRHTTPAFTALTEANVYRGMVGTQWQADSDRDNRGKVYLYFCPEDMTVALNNVQGIGWQGVPDFITGERAIGDHNDPALSPGERAPVTESHTREALKELGPGFFQRVFTARQRAEQPGQEAQPELVGSAPHDYALRVKGEDDHAHVAKGSDTLRASNPAVDWPVKPKVMGVFPKSAAMLRKGIRRITGEPLKRPVPADMYAGSISLPGQPQGAHETVDPIDAAISVTSRYGLKPLPQQVIDDPRPPPQRTRLGDYVALTPHECQQVAEALNEGKSPSDCCTVQQGSHQGEGKLRIVRCETPNEARLRQQQHGVSARSFHGAIFGSRLNHQQVTAYDLSIGGGKAVSDPLFYGYLCAVADWRLKKTDRKEVARPGILTWAKFQEQFALFFDVEPPWRVSLIEGNCDYYSTGVLPNSLPVLPEGLPPAVVSDTVSGQRIDTRPEPEPPKKAEAAPLTMGEWMAQNRLPQNAQELKDGDA